jgi:hypothetical protein
MMVLILHYSFGKIHHASINVSSAKNLTAGMWTGGNTKRKTLSGSQNVSSVFWHSKEHATVNYFHVNEWLG